MYRIENIGNKIFYIKFTGHFTPANAQKYLEEFKEISKDTENFSLLVDLIDASMLGMESIDLILTMLQKESKKLHKSAYVISENPPLEVEFNYLFSKAPSPKRKLVSDLEEAKKWLGLEDIVIQ